MVGITTCSSGGRSSALTSRMDVMLGARRRRPASSAVLTVTAARSTPSCSICISSRKVHLEQLRDLGKIAGQAGVGFGGVLGQGDHLPTIVVCYAPLNRSELCTRQVLARLPA